MNAKDESLKDPAFETYMEEQQKEILSPFNRYVTGEKVGRDPTDEELAMHYIENGGAKAFSQRHNRNIEGTDL